MNKEMTASLTNDSTTSPGVDPKVELIFQTFNDFIQTYHSSGEEEDCHIRFLWEGLKKVIEKDPKDIKAQHEYISSMVIANPLNPVPAKITVARR